MSGEVHHCVDDRCLAHRVGVNHPRHNERIKIKDFNGKEQRPYG